MLLITIFISILLILSPLGSQKAGVEINAYQINDAVSVRHFCAKGFDRSLLFTEYAKKQSNQSGYIYFHDFIPNNDSDI